MLKDLFNSYHYPKYESGSALVMALLVLLVMSIVVIGMATDSDMDLKISRNLQLKNEAFNNAETGIALTEEALRYATITQYQSNSSVNETFSVNFQNYQLSFYKDKNLETHASFGQLYHQDGLDVVYVAIADSEISENLISLVAVKSNDYSGEDRKWFSLDSTGYKENDTKIGVYVIIEEMDASMKLNSPLSIFNDHPSLTLRGNTWISYKNHNVPDDFNCVGSDCSNVSSLDEGDVENSIFSTDELDLIISGQLEEQIDGGEDKIGQGDKFEKEYWSERALYFQSIAEDNDRVFVNNEDPDTLGSRDYPMVTVLDGVNINNANGSGVLILRGGARITGNAHFEGIVITILGEDEDSALFSGGTNTVFGGMVVLGDVSEVELEDESSEDVEFAGNPYVKYSRQALLSAMMAIDNNAPLKELSWKSE